MAILDAQQRYTLQHEVLRIRVSMALFNTTLTYQWISSYGSYIQSAKAVKYNLDRLEKSSYEFGCTFVGDTEVCIKDVEVAWNYKRFTVNPIAKRTKNTLISKQHEKSFVLTSFVWIQLRNYKMSTTRSAFLKIWTTLIKYCFITKTILWRFMILWLQTCFLLRTWKTLWKC